MTRICTHDHTAPGKEQSMLEQRSSLVRSAFLSFLIILSMLLLTGCSDTNASATHPKGSFAEFSLPINGAPEAITAGPDGNLWFTEKIGNQIGRITPAGKITEFRLPTPNSFPAGIVAGSDGRLWFVELAGAIGSITPAGTISEYPVPDFTRLAGGIARGPDGNLWFSELTGSVGRITPTGTFTHFPLLATPSLVEQMTFSKDGALWFSDRATGNIGRFMQGAPV